MLDCNKVTTMIVLSLLKAVNYWGSSRLLSMSVSNAIDLDPSSFSSVYQGDTFVVGKI